MTTTWPAEPQSVPQARRWLQSLCRDTHSADRCDDAELLIAELVGNAVRHTETPVEVEVVLSAASLRLTVVDGSSRPLRPRPVDPLAESGRGLQLVDLLSDRWGVEADRRGKRVWVELS